jgi:hypothetical protein
MKDKPFDMPVIVNLHCEEDRDVGSVKEALDVLVGEWPAGKGGPAHAEAIRACRGSLDGQYPVEKARDAFSAAAWEAELFVSDMGRLSEALA